MFKKLKIQLLTINAICLTIVILIIFLGIYYITLYEMNLQVSVVLNDIARNEETVSLIKGPSNNVKMVVSSSFFIKINKYGKVFGYSKNINIPKCDITNLKNTVLKKGIQYGNIKTGHLRFKFLKVPKKYGFIIAFIDNNMEINLYTYLIISFLFVGTISVILVIIISLYLANKAIVPVKTTLDKQNIFIADASHELRTPLAVLNSTLEIVVENKDKTVHSQMKWINNIQSELFRMTKLIEDLLFLARVKKEEMPMSNFNISTTINNTYETFKVLTNKKNIELIFNIENEIIILGNEWRIIQLINIMLDNAIKHTPSNGKIEVCLLKHNNICELKIKDNGEGIPKEHIEKIFERFYRVDKSRSRSQGGTGLGLSIAQSIVDEHRGSINVLSTIGIGSEFHIMLPITF